jgi:hypothetical protein
LACQIHRPLLVRKSPVDGSWINERRYLTRGLRRLQPVHRF